MDSLGRETTPDKYVYTRVITNYSQKSVRYVVTDFYRNGRKRMTGATLDRDILKKDGEFVYYYNNGSKERVINYADDHKVGKEFSWYDNKNIKSEKENSWNSTTKTSQTLIRNFWNKDNEQTVSNGEGEYEDSDEFITEKGSVKNGLKEGVWKGTDLLNKISFVENYEKGVLISGTSMDENNVKHSYSSLNQKYNSKNIKK